MNALKQLLSEAQTSISSTSLYYSYELSNITIKAEVISLLPIVVEKDGDEYNIEDVADVSLADDYHFIIEAKDPDDLFAIAKAIKLEHPLFEIEQVERENRDIYDNTFQDDYLNIKMPEVTSDLYDSYMDFVSTHYDETKLELDALKVKYSGEMLKDIPVPTPEQIDAVDETLSTIVDKGIEKMDQSRKMKEDEINKAYEEYLSGLAESEAEATQSADNKRAASQMSFE